AKEAKKAAKEAADKARGAADKAKAAADAAANAARRGRQGVVWDGAGVGPRVRRDGGRGPGGQPPPMDLVPAIADGGDFAVLYGYLSGADGRGIRRLYLTWDLDQYVELTDADIYYWRKV